MTPFAYEHTPDANEGCMYGGSMLRRLSLVESQALARDLLRHLAAFCKEHGIEFYLIGGALIGAVREGDLVAWDDDIDVAMKRSDFDRFCCEYKDSDRYRLFTFERKRDYRHGMAKLVDANTYLVEKTARGPALGVFVDIFPLDETNGPQSREMKAIFRLKTLYQYAYAITPKATEGNRRASLVRILLSGTAGRFPYKFVRAFVERKLRSGKGPYLANYWGAWGAKECAPVEWFASSVPVRLGEDIYPAPVGYHEWLTQVYGDYMKPPSNPPHRHGIAYLKYEAE